MNVCIVCEVLGEENNGTTIAAMNLIRYLRSKGHKVNVICPDKDKERKSGFYVFPKINLGLIVNYMVVKNNVILSRFDKNIAYQAMKDADVVHIMMPLFISSKTSKFAKELHKPITAGFHPQAENFTAHLRLSKLSFVNHLTYLKYNSNLYKRVNAIHYPTDFIRSIFEKEIHHKTNGYVISNGVNKIFHPQNGIRPDIYKDKFVIVFTGRLSKEKSHIILLKVINKSKYKDKIQLIFAGQGPLENELKKYSLKHLTNQPLIKFFTHDELVNILCYTDLYCHPAEVEIEAIACLEAISCGLVPLISDSKKCATKELAKDSRCLFKCNNIKDLSNKIDYFIENPEEKNKLKKIYLKESVNFEQEKCMV